ncbi:type IV pili twitching motility protein PilT [Candidatus Kuenenbacteria bacterium CG08_land_8_20_14_0_20_37_23]|uniref:Type IV pili twitching motility protein PilT n=1 Tax=Candidatus Kuenenbacteria bacterium CG08_land_8_20_14_0_20_37_23 TaxID=1974617 RepID=A0A2M6XSC3_9BACT|nr:MAG: type IV pili twitching motility protein PilT [Candidatus Kuenenbacteria bacterium CG08_land_8_20_14_0_20_37_23]
MTINQIFTAGVEKNASDIHLAVGKPPIVRVHGKLVELQKMDILTKTKAETLVLSILSSSQKEKYIKKRELDLAYEIDNVSRFRVNLHFEKGMPGLVARIIQNKILNMEKIAMPDIVYSLARLYQGLILLTGPTGCGKSTSLAAIIDLINRERACNIVTLEDPIEFTFNSEKSIIRQRQYGFDFLSFPEALKHVVRQDPNVIMVGEMRDLETIATTITLAETGHLVLATLHTQNAAQTIDRIIDIFPPYQQDQIRMQLSLSLAGVISQQLISGINNDSRIAAREIMINTPAIANLIRENKIPQIKTIIQTSSDEGMISMDQSLKQLAEQKLISKDVARAYAVDPSIIK